MMKRVIVSILSDHVIPNYLFIKEMEGKYDELVFITTDYVLKKEIAKHLEKALGVPIGSVDSINVTEDNYAAIKHELEKHGLDKSNHYVVNITGGTKVMSLAIHDFFHNFKTAQFVYIPIGKNQYCDLETSEVFPLQYRVDLRQYFALYGMRCEFSTAKDFLKPEKDTKIFFASIKANDFRIPFQIRKARNGNSEMSPRLRKYYTGAWFEEYCFSRLKRENGLKDNHIGQSLKIYRDNNSLLNDNEIDVAFVRDNALYVVECKYSMKGYSILSKKDVIEEYLYKLAAISKDLGLRVNSYLFTLHPKEDFPKGLEKRIRILGIKGIIGQEELSQINLNI